MAGGIGSGIDSVVPPGGGEKEVPEIIAAIGACQYIKHSKIFNLFSEDMGKNRARFLFFFYRSRSRSSERKPRLVNY